uniref:Aa_trans domain-containing protein n=1 Tax=Globodera pallida TaxID=36090 RepID=A0A183C2A8_GLOPA
MVTTGFNDRISNDHHALPFVLSRRGKREGGNQPVGCIVLGLSAFVAAVTGALEIAKVFPGGVIAIAICFGAAVLCLILMICACNWLK